MPAPEPARETLTGKTLGHYRILEKIGAGGMGEVYRAHDEHLEREVAIKVLPPGTLADDTARKRFRKEALALSKLNHPNIATIHDFDTQQGLNFLVMELIRGLSLREKLAGEPLEEKQILDLGTQLAVGLSAAHEHGVVHRDLKPGNLRITADGRVKILDFGLAKLFDPTKGEVRAETLTQSVEDSQLMGTLPYMAPEQLSGEHIDARTDVYGVGVVLYEMATQKRPFREESSPRLLASILQQPVEAPSAINPRLSPELERIILKCLEKEPDRRFQSARELAVDLDRCAHPSETQTGRLTRKPAWQKALSSVRLHPLAFTSSSVAVAVVAVLLFWVFGARPVLSFSPRNFVLISDFDNQTGDVLFDRSLRTALVVSVEQSAQVNVVPTGRMGDSLRRMGKKPGDYIDESTGRQMCVRESIPVLLVPAISRVGQEYALSARLINPRTGVSAWSHMEMADGQNAILPALGKLAAQVRHGLGESWFRTYKQDRKLPLVTTSSLSALKMYVDGQDAWRKGQYPQAMQVWNSALRADPDFAMVHAAVGTALYSYIFNEPVEGKRHFERALQLSDRTTERERLFLRAMFAVNQNHFPEASQLLQEYLQEYPDDSGARFSLAHLLRDNDRCPEAVEQYKEVLRVDPNSAASMVDIATCNASADNYTEAIRFYEQAFQLEPSWKNGGNLTREYGLDLVKGGQEAKARELFTAALANPDSRGLTLRSLAYLDLYHGRYRTAKTGLQEALLLDEANKVPLSIAREHCILGMVYEGLGDNRSQIRELDAAMRLYPSIPDKVISGTWLARGYVRAGLVDKAAAVVDTMRKQVDMNDPSRASLVSFAEAEVERQRGNYAHAIELLLLADRQHPSKYISDSLARAYGASGDIEQAARWLKALNEGKEALGWEPQQDWLSSFVRLARANMSLGKKDEAKALLSQFLDLWKDADPDLPLLKKANAEYEKLR